MSVFCTGAASNSSGSPIYVTITGQGRSSYCSTTINGTTYYDPTSGIEVYAGDTIILTVSAMSWDGEITIDNVTVVTTDEYDYNYEWTVPDGISSIEIYLYATFSSITVTTS